MLRLNEKDATCGRDQMRKELLKDENKWENCFLWVRLISFKPWYCLFPMN